METTFKNLLFRTAFCCMTCDGNIDDREVAIIRSMCAKSPLFEGFDFQTEVNRLLDEFNQNGAKFMTEYLDSLKRIDLSEEDELTLLDFAVQTVMADDQIEYTEIKFVKNIRFRLKISDEKILERFPDFEQFLEEDIMINPLMEQISAQFFDIAQLPQFQSIVVDAETNQNP